MKKTLSKSIASAAAVGVAITGAASAATYSEDFNSFDDGTTDVGNGTTLGSNLDTAGFPTGQASVQGGELRITQDDVNSQRASFRIPALPNSSLGWTASFDFTMFDAAGGNPPADGFSFNYGDILPLTTQSNGPTGHGNAEGGMGGTQIAFVVDTWQLNNQNNPPGVGILGAGSVIRTDGTVLDQGGSLTGTATISWSPSEVSYNTTGLDTNADFNNVAQTFAGDDNYGWAFSARTGGANEEFRIDNLSIVTIPEPSALALLGLGLGGLILRRRRS